MMLNNEEEEDDISFYVQKNKPTMLKSVTGLNKYGSLADERIKANREPLTGSVNKTLSKYFISFFVDKDDYYHEPRVRRPSIVIREHQFAQYPINYDPSPHIIRKKIDDQHEPVVYKQQIAVRYLCPPTPPPPAPLIIREVRLPEPSPLPPSS
jgi:hypothetical protein